MPNPAEFQVSATEVERFKAETTAVRMFVSKLQVLVKELEAQVGPNNVVYRSMARFLKRMV